MSESQKGLIVVLIIAVPALCVVLVTPFYIDNYIYHSMASDIYRYGKIPYMGSWNYNFPGIIGVHYMAILIFGPREIGFRVFDVIVQLGFAVMFYRLLLRWLRPRTAALAVILYILYYVGHGQPLYGQREIYLTMLIFASFFLLLKGKKDLKRVFAWIGLAGLLGGFAVIMKPTAIFNLALLALYVLLNRNDRSYGELGPAKPAVSRSVIFMMAGILPLAVVLIYYYSFPGGLQAFYLSAVRLNIDVYTQFHTPFHDFLAELGHYGILLAFAGYSLLRPKSSLLPFLSRDPKSDESPGSKKDKLFLLFLVASNILVVLLQRKYIPYHFVPFFMCVIPLSAIGIERLTSRIGPSALRYFVVIVCVAGSVLIRFSWQYPVIFVQAFFQNESTNSPIDHALRATYEAAYSSPDWGAKPEQRVIDYLGRPENDSGAVEVFSYVPLLRVHLDRVFAGPYISLNAIACRDDGGIGPIPHYTDYQIRWRAAYMDTLRSVKPRFLIIDRKTQYWYLHDAYESWLRYMPGFDSLLNSSYRYDTSFGGYQIFRLSKQGTTP